jgi:hypothetical protein
VLINRLLYNDGGYATFTYTQLAISDPCNKEATITGIRSGKTCQRPNTGAIFLASGSPARVDAGTFGVQLELQLDSRDPEALMRTPADGLAVEPYDTGTLMTVPAYGTTVVDIEAYSLRRSCTFAIELAIAAGGQSWNQLVGDDGQLFRVSALLPAAVAPGSKHPFSGYHELYLGAAASPWHDDSWTRESPATWSRAAA